MATQNNWNCNIESGPAITLNTTTNAINISNDAANTTINIGTGTGAKAVLLGSTDTNSALTLNYGTNGFNIASASGNILTALSTGEINEPLQSCFFALLNPAVTNVTGDDSSYVFIPNSSIYDQSGDYNTGTGVFTAGVTGQYLITFNVHGGGYESNHLYQRTTIVTTLRNYIMNWYAPYTCRTSTGFTGVNYSFAVHMDAADTAYITITVGTGNKTVDLSASATTPYTSFGCFLLE